MKDFDFPQKSRRDLSNKCPKCEYLHICPCRSCVKSRKEDNDRNKDIKPWIWINGEVIKCPNCGLTNHCDWWQDWEYHCYTAEHGSLTKYLEAMDKKNEQNKST